MKIEHFNHYSCYLGFDPMTGKVTELDGGVGTDEAVCGIGDIINGKGVALLASGGKMHIYVGEKKFDLASSSLCISYVHHNDGTTVFEVVDASKEAMLTYPSWWKTGVGVPGLGAGSDEDEDFLGYVYFMSRQPARIAHLLWKYSK